MTPSETFIGFATLEGWIEAIDPNRPLLAMPLVQPGPIHAGLQTDQLLVVCRQVDPRGCVLYCRLRAASLTRCYGEPFDADWQARETAWHTLWDAVESSLKERGCTLQRATVAWPKDHVFLEGRSQEITFDRASRTYLRRVPSCS